MSLLRQLRKMTLAQAILITLAVGLVVYNKFAGGVDTSHPVSQGDRVFMGLSLLGGVALGHLAHRQSPRTAIFILGLLTMLPLIGGVLALSMTGDVRIGPRLPWYWLGFAAGVVQAVAVAAHRERRAVASGVAP